ncbi:MAG: hypothetical protein HZA52_05850 [Planctomycetes bacterium]|nr:hypothetical protein [Planctomycetota bacterium]
MAALSLAAALSVTLAACSGGDDGERGPQGPPGGSGSTNTALEQGDELPAIELTITDVRGGSGPGGSFKVGDTVKVDFTVTKSDATAWDLSEFSSGSALLSGPTFNYQRVLPEVSDVHTNAVERDDGSFTYTFAAPIPATYLAPYNDSASFGASDGELTGDDLLDGTYTVGLYFVWSYTVDGAPHRDAGNATFDLQIGTGTVTPREVVTQDACNQCHVDLRAHGDMRRDVTLCLLCHTSGSEDKNDLSVANGTPGVSVDFRVMIHKIHAGAHLPSVLGVATNSDGTRNYAATPAPYELVGYQDAITDFSEVGFPIMPSAYTVFTYDATGVNYTGAFGNGPMPRDIGYSSLSLTEKQLEDRMRTGPVACDKCHGDPDGTGPLSAPAQGDLYKQQPSRVACGSCHDDISWGDPYTSNLQTMPAQATDADCTLCHAESGDSLAVEDAHLHPYLNANFNTGVNLDLSGVGGGSGPGGNHQAGDPIEVTFSVTDDIGADIGIHSLTRLQLIVAGPTSNPQWMMGNVNPFDFSLRKSTPFTGTGTASTPTVANGAVAQTIAVVFNSATAFDVVGSVSAALVSQAIGGASGNTASVSYNGVTFTLTQGATQFANGDRFYFEVVPPASSYTLNVPRDVSFELLGEATGGADVLDFGNTPSYWGRQVVYERTALVGSSTTLTAASEPYGRYVACDSSLLALAVGDRVVLDDGLATEEYVQIGRIQTTDDESSADLGDEDRVWFSTGLRYAHAVGAAIQECTLTTKREGIAYTLATSGASDLTLVGGQFTATNPVIVSYRTDGRFGFYNAAGEALQAVYGPFATGESDDIDVTWGDWKGLPLVDGTYSVGGWANRDFTVTPTGSLTTLETFSNISTNNTTYRMMANPAVLNFLYGAATDIEPRALIASGDDCNRCHGDLASHGFGRRGLDTCMLCHATASAEDGSKYSFATWYVGPTPGVTMDFRTLLHKAHMGKDLANASSYTVNGIFLGTIYPVHYDEVELPIPGGARNCELCHGEGNDTWQTPGDRDHPTAAVAPARDWRGACGSCHDSDAASAHIEVQTTIAGAESCAVCHGADSEWSVERVHKSY